MRPLHTTLEAVARDTAMMTFAASTAGRLAALAACERAACCPEAGADQHRLHKSLPPAEDAR